MIIWMMRQQRCSLQNILLAFLILSVWNIRPIRCLINVDLRASNEEGKGALPDKGIRQCQSLGERYTSFIDQKVSSDWLLPCDTYDESTPTSLQDEFVENSINITIFASLPAYAPNVAWIVSFVVNGFLNDSAIEYEFRSSGMQTPKKNEIVQGRSNVQAILIHNRTLVYQILRKTPTNWWWQYDLVFECFQERINSNAHDAKDYTYLEPIQDQYKRLQIQTKLKKYLALGITAMSVIDFQGSLHGLFAFSQEDPRRSDTPFRDHPITDVPSLSPVNTWPSLNEENSGTLPLELDKTSNNLHGTYTETVNPRFWDWRRYFGAILFIATIMFTLFVSILAAYRQRRLSENEVWGNLATEEGVDALLGTTWKIQGEMLTCYNKESWGYRDDDSMLIGGYEQTVPCSDSKSTTESTALEATLTPSPPDSLQ